MTTRLYTGVLPVDDSSANLINLPTAGLIRVKNVGASTVYVGGVDSTSMDQTVYVPAGFPVDPGESCDIYAGTDTRYMIGANTDSGDTSALRYITTY